MDLNMVQGGALGSTGSGQGLRKRETSLTVLQNIRKCLLTEVNGVSYYDEYLSVEM
jgi:hypothetical protein